MLVDNASMSFSEKSEKLEDKQELYWEKHSDKLMMITEIPQKIICSEDSLIELPAKDSREEQDSYCTEQQET